MKNDKKNISSTADNIKIDKQSDTIEVKKEKLDALLDRLTRLESAANKAGLAKYDSTQRKDLKKVIKIITYEGKVVKRWGNMVKDKVEKNPISKNWHEDQIMELTFYDDTKQEVPYEVFSVRYQKEEAIVDKEIVNNKKEDIEKYGARTLEVTAIESNKKYVLGSKFVN